MNPVLAMLIVLVVFVIGWFFTAKKLSAKHWLIRHLIGSVVGFIAFLLTMIVLGASGLVETTPVEDSQIEVETVSAEIPAVPEQNEMPTAPAAPSENKTAVESAVEAQDELEEESEEENVFSPEQQAILDDFKPRMAALAESGISMEPLRHSDDLNKLAQCGDLMRKNQADLRQMRDEYSAAMKGLALHHRFHPNFEPLFIAEANLIRCVTCLPTALPDCQEAIQALESGK